MHRKFIALIVAAAIAVTGLSASRAQAADARDILGGLAAIAIVGAAVHQYNKKKDREREREYNRQVTRSHNYDYDDDDYRPQHKRHNKPHHVRPLPKRVAKYNLPQRCLRQFNNYSGKHPLLGQRCLNKHYKHVKSLPKSCKVGFWNGNKVRHAYEPRCLRQQGYRVVYNR